MTIDTTMRIAAIDAAMRTSTTPSSSRRRVATRRSEAIAHFVAIGDLLVQCDAAAPEAGFDRRRALGHDLNATFRRALPVRVTRRVGAGHTAGRLVAAAGLVERGGAGGVHVGDAHDSARHS